MYITIDMLTDPIFYLGLVPFMFFLGGKWTPLSQTKWYKTFWKSIGFKDISLQTRKEGLDGSFTSRNDRVNSPVVS